jgi:N-acetylmuramoyl-L-alanine amidase
MNLSIIDRSKKFSEFFEKKREPRQIEFLVLHHIEAKSVDQALELLKKDQVSAHFLIDESGKIFELVDENDVAYHAGVSFWRGNESLNRNSIGIEFLNSAPFTKKFENLQMQSAIALCQYLMDKYAIPVINVVGHSDVAYYPVPYPVPQRGEDEGFGPSSGEENKKAVVKAHHLDRKQDPSHLFDWKLLAKQGVGFFPEISLPANQDKILFKFGDRSEEIKAFKEALSKFGYYVINTSDEFDYATKHLVLFFNRRFNPQKFAENSDVWYLSSQMLLDELARV